ncbi:MAG: YbdK family carboxylate-amine ligase [Chlamydiota bacterium]|nr:YbdK family carboxylate-amine ligase [Chlamydiota bacterium]
MEVPFNGSKGHTLGVEIELQIIDPKTQAYKFCAPQLLDRCRKKGLVHIKNELNQATVEVDTKICKKSSDVRESLAESVSILMEMGNKLDFSLLACGSHPSFFWEKNRIYPNERYKRVVDKLQIAARRVQVYGLHVHVGVPDGDTALAICNSAMKYLPHLLALSANSPFWQGSDTGLESYRASIMGSMPMSGFPYYFENWNAFSRYYNTLVQSQVITAMKDVYWFVRPSPAFGTVEFRICDMTSSLDETIALVALIQSMVVWMKDNLKSNPENYLKDDNTYWFAPENLWMAQRYGLDGRIVHAETLKRVSIREELEKLLSILSPYAQDLGCEEDFLYVYEMIKRGNGATRQLAKYRESGKIKDVIGMLENDFSRQVVRRNVMHSKHP